VRAAIYARKSTEQSGVNDEEKSVTRQIEHARADAIRKSWQIADDHIYADDGISGAEFETRPGLVRLLNALKLKPRPFDWLILSEESRLGRESFETGYILKQILSSGVRIWCYLEHKELALNNASDKILLSVTSVIADMERERARQRTRDALERKAKAGHVTGGAVFGYRNVDVRDDPNGRRQHVILEINSEEARIIRRIFSLYADDGLGPRKIAHLLNAEGALAPKPRRAGRPRSWAASTIHDILRRPLYVGTIVWGRKAKRDSWGRKRYIDRPQDQWQRLDAPHLRIVSSDVWQSPKRACVGERSPTAPQSSPPPPAAPPLGWSRSIS